MDGFPGVLKQSDQYGRRVLVLFSANWNNERYGLASIYRALLLTLEKLISEEETQVNGFVIIVDWSQFTFKQSTWINPKILKLMIEGLQVNMKHIYFALKCSFMHEIHIYLDYVSFTHKYCIYQ